MPPSSTCDRRATHSCRSSPTRPSNRCRSRPLSPASIARCWKSSPARHHPRYARPVGHGRRNAGDGRCAHSPRTASCAGKSALSSRLTAASNICRVRLPSEKCGPWSRARQIVRRENCGRVGRHSHRRSLTCRPFARIDCIQRIGLRGATMVREAVLAAPVVALAACVVDFEPGPARPLPANYRLMFAQYGPRPQGPRCIDLLSSNVSSVSEWSYRRWASRSDCLISVLWFSRVLRAHRGLVASQRLPRCYDWHIAKRA